MKSKSLLLIALACLVSAISIGARAEDAKRPDCTREYVGFRKAVQHKGSRGAQSWVIEADRACARSIASALILENPRVRIYREGKLLTTYSGTEGILAEHLGEVMVRSESQLDVINIRADVLPRSVQLVGKTSPTHEFTVSH